MQLLATLAVLVLGGAAVLRMSHWMHRVWGRRRIQGAALQRAAYGAGIRCTFEGTAPALGLNPRRVHRLSGDLLLAGDHLVVTSTRGVLLDTARPRGAVSAARCPGPDRLVIEGPALANAQPPRPFRLEIAVPEAQAWATSLRHIVAKPFVSDGG